MRFGWSPGFSRLRAIRTQLAHTVALSLRACAKTEKRPIFRPPNKDLRQEKRLFVDFCTNSPREGGIPLAEREGYIKENRSSRDSTNPPKPLGAASPVAYTGEVVTAFRRSAPCSPSVACWRAPAR